MLDAGCGQADLLDYLVRQEDAPASYTGLEAVADFAAVAQINCRQLHPTARVITGDFVLEPHHLDTSAEVLVFCGSLNTLSPAQFYATLRRAYAAARQAVLFNFLCSPQLAGADWLHWHAPQAVLRFAHELGATTTLIDDYLDGDCTIALWKTP